MADWTAITGIVVSGVVGPTVAALWATMHQAKQAESAIAFTDRSAARALLDEAAQALREVVGRAGALNSSMIKWGSKLGREGGVDEVANFRRTAQAADLLEPRISIMFGKDKPVTATYVECMTALQRIARGVNMIDMDKSEYMMDVTEGFEQADEAHHRFLEAAHEAIGPR